MQTAAQSGHAVIFNDHVDFPQSTESLKGLSLAVVAQKTLHHSYGAVGVVVELGVCATPGPTSDFSATPAVLRSQV